MVKTEIAIDAKNITKKFGTRTLFSDISCSLTSGDCLIITGHNGSGKSTLIKIFARLLQPTSGAITFSADGQTCRDWEEIQPYIGFVSPEIMFYENLSGRENVEFVARVRGFRLRPAQIEGALANIGLGAKGKQQVKTYSTGMKQRLKFAALAALDPPIWFIDEGLSNLDADGRGMVLTSVEQALGRGCVIIMATNEHVEVEYATQTIALA